MTSTPRARQETSRRLAALNCFDPWRSPLCTCSPKLSLDPYTGCPGECVYCYAATYLWRYWGAAKVRPKRDLLTRLRRDLGKIATGDDPDLARLRGAWVTVSNSSDPYPEAPQANEGELRLTRAALQLLAESRMGILLQTKSDLFIRDLDVLPPGRTVIGVTITTADLDLASRLEPGMAEPGRRLEAIRQATEAGFAVLARVDPLIVGLNDRAEALRGLVGRLAASGARHVVSSTVKLQPQSRRRLAEAFPEIAAGLALYSDSQGHGGYWQLPLARRRELLEGLRELVLAAGMTFAVCREGGLSGLNTAACDGRHLSGC